MRIIIDADACPVVSFAVTAAKDFSLEAVIFSDTSHIISSDYAKCITVDKGADSADFAILSYCVPDDIIVTGDYALAAMCLAKKALAIKPDGTEYSDRNIDLMLNGRYLAKKMRDSGARAPKTKKRTRAEDEAFNSSIRALIQKHSER